MTHSRKPSQRRVLSKIITNCAGQAYLAERLGVSQALVSKWVNDHIRIAPHQALALEREFPDLVNRRELRPDLWG